jgi:hypothetical protein
MVIIRRRLNGTMSMEIPIYAPEDEVDDKSRECPSVMFA